MDSGLNSPRDYPILFEIKQPVVGIVQRRDKKPCKKRTGSISDWKLFNSRCVPRRRSCGYLCLTELNSTILVYVERGA